MECGPRRRGQSRIWRLGVCGHRADVGCGRLLADGSGGGGELGVSGADLAMREEEEEVACEGGVWDEVIKCGVHTLFSIYGEGVSR